MPSIFLDIRLDGKQARSRGFSSEILFAIVVTYDVFREHHESVAISCGTDGTHTANSPHYAGNAFDIRRPNEDKMDTILTDLRRALGKDYQVLPEVSHIHVQYRPADPLNAEGASVKG